MCFITQTGGREAFLGSRIPFRRGTVVDSDGAKLGEVSAIELVTVGQRRGIGLPGGGPKRYEADLYVTELAVDQFVWADQPYTGEVMVQCSAHGAAMPARLDGHTVRWNEPQRCVAPGQSVVFYDASNRYVLGGGIAA